MSINYILEKAYVAFMLRLILLYAPNICLNHVALSNKHLLPTLSDSEYGTVVLYSAQSTSVRDVFKQFQRSDTACKEPSNSIKLWLLNYMIIL